MRFQRIYEQVHFRPWFISPEGHASIARLLESKLARSEMDFSDFVSSRPTMSIDAARVAHIHIFGTLGQGLSPIEKSCGATDYADVEKDVLGAQSAGARAIMLHVDSPGGMCSGCSEASAVIAAATIPTLAFTDSLMASAAYSLAAGCNRIVSTESAMVGCIGTILPWVDSSARWEQAGLEFQPITNAGADLKATGHGPSLTPEQVKHLTELAEDYAAQFIGHVQRFKTIDAEALRGGCYVGARANRYGLTDAIGSYADAYQTLLGMLT